MGSGAVPLPDVERAYRSTQLPGNPEVAILDLAGTLTGSAIGREADALSAVDALARYLPLSQLIVLDTGKGPSSGVGLGEIARHSYHMGFATHVIASDVQRLRRDLGILLTVCHSVAWHIPASQLGRAGTKALSRRLQRLFTRRPVNPVADFGLMISCAEETPGLEESLLSLQDILDFLAVVSTGWPRDLPLLFDPRGRIPFAVRRNTCIIAGRGGEIWADCLRPVLLGKHNKSPIEVLWAQRSAAAHEPISPDLEPAIVHFWRRDPAVLSAFVWPISEEGPPHGALERLTPEDPACAGGIATHVSRYAFAAQLCRAKRVLDVGCGVGYGSDYLAAQGAAEVVGLDISEEAIAYAKRHYRRPNLRYLRGNALSLPTDIGSFDVVVALEVFEHVTDPGWFLDQLSAHLREDGVLVVSTPNKLTFSPGFPSDSSPNEYHAREYYRDEFLAILESRFERVSLYGQRMEHNYLARQREVSQRAQAVSTLQAQLKAESEARSQQAASLQGQVEGLTSQLKAESEARSQQAASLQGQVEGLTSQLKAESEARSQQAASLQGQVEGLTSQLKAESEARSASLSEVHHQMARLLGQIELIGRVIDGNLAMFMNLARRLQRLAAACCSSPWLRLQLGKARADQLLEFARLDLDILDLPAPVGDGEALPGAGGRPEALKAEEREDEETAAGI
jgi:cyclopropane fatty-acyl-phospholipid synthase-like methyltransferase